MSNELLTEKEEKRRKRNASIVADFATEKREHPEASDWRIICLLARRYDVSAMTIHNIIKG